MIEPISLSIVERRILANQEMILAKLEPSESADHERLARIYESGYQLEYREALRIYDEFPESACKEVLDIMTMYQFLQLSYDNLSDKSDIEEREVLFQGFDANDDSLHLSYANFYCQSQRRFGFLRFGEGKIEDQFDGGFGVSLNGHFSVLDSYRRMLELWREFKKENSERWDRMTKEEMRAILDEAIHPSNRKAPAE